MAAKTDPRFDSRDPHRLPGKAELKESQKAAPEGQREADPEKLGRQDDNPSRSATKESQKAAPKGQREPETHKTEKDPDVAETTKRNTGKKDDGAK